MCMNWIYINLPSCWCPSGLWLKVIIPPRCYTYFHIFQLMSLMQMHYLTHKSHSSLTRLMHILPNEASQTAQYHLSPSQNISKVIWMHSKCFICSTKSRMRQLQSSLRFSWIRINQILHFSHLYWFIDCQLADGARLTLSFFPSYCNLERNLVWLRMQVIEETVCTISSSNC